MRIKDFVFFNIDEYLRRSLHITIIFQDRIVSDPCHINFILSFFDISVWKYNLKKSLENFSEHIIF